MKKPSASSRRRITTQKERRRRSIFLKACASDERGKIRELLNKGVCATFTDERTGANPLYAASVNGHSKVVRLLLDAGADPDLPATWKNNENPSTTPLEVACQNGHIATARILIQRGASINKKGYFTPLTAAVSYGQPKSVRLLLQHRSRIERGALHLAVRAGSAEIVKRLIAAGADVNQRNSNGETPLHWAATKDAKIAKLLIDAGAKIDALTRYTKETPLVKAAQRGNLRVTKFLVDAGANLTLKGLRNKNAEEWARAFGHKDVAAFLRGLRNMGEQTPRTKN